MRARVLASRVSVPVAGPRCEDSSDRESGIRKLWGRTGRAALAVLDLDEGDVRNRSDTGEVRTRRPWRPRAVACPPQTGLTRCSRTYHASQPLGSRLYHLSDSRSAASRAGTCSGFRPTLARAARRLQRGVSQLATRAGRTNVRLGNLDQGSQDLVDGLSVRECFGHVVIE